MRVLFVVLLASLTAFPLFALDGKLLVAGVFADSSIAGPALRFTNDDGKGNKWMVGLTGRVIEGEWQKPMSGTRFLVLGAELQPFNAHNSDRQFVNGERVDELEYEGSAYRVRGGLRFMPNPRSTTDVFLVGLVEDADEAPQPGVRQFWDKPYYGVDLSHTFNITRGERPLVSSWDGFAIVARVEAYTGDETWSRVSLAERGAKQFGKIHLRQSVMGMNGKSLNVVSRFQVGGGWDVLGDTAMYGFKYGEYRIARGVLANAGADYVLPRDWRIGVRASYLHSDVDKTYGASLNATKIWKTFGFNFGVGAAEERGGDSEPVVYFGLIAPLYYKPLK